MVGYVERWDRNQSFLLPESVDDYVGEDNPVRVVDAFVDELGLVELGFGRTTPADTGRPASTQRRCSSSTSTATSTACRPAAA